MASYFSKIETRGKRREGLSVMIYIERIYQAPELEVSYVNKNDVLGIKIKTLNIN